MANETGSPHEPRAEQPDAKNDTDVGTKLDKLLSHLDSFSSRLDALEAKGKRTFVEDPDGDGTPGDGKVTTPDADGKIEAKGETKELAADAAEESAIKADCQLRWDSVAMAHGSRAPAPLSGESVMAYRRRLTRQFQRHSADFGKVDLVKASANADVFTAIENKIYADAMVAARNPDVAPNSLREIVTVDATGRRISNFFGSKGPRGTTHTMFSEMNRPGRRITSIRTKFD